MAKASERQGNEYVALPKGVIDTLNNDEPVTDEELAFDEFVAGMSAERMGELRVGKIKVAKDGTPVANTRSAHCFSCPIDQFTYSGLIDHIRAKYGAGLYRVVGVETGKRGLVFNRLIEIAEELNPPKSAESPLQNPSNYLESVGKIMAESAARTEGLIARLTEAKPPAADPMDSMMKMATLFSTIMGSMAGLVKPAAPASDLLSQLEVLTKLKELTGGGGGGDSGAESNFFDVVKAGLQSFGPALAALAVRQHQTATPALAPPAPIAPHQPAFSPAPTFASQPLPAAAPAGDSGMSSLKRQVDLLVQNAKNGADAKELANTILDLTPDEKLDALGEMLEAPDMIDKMALLNPEVKNHLAFFEALRSNLLSLLGDAETDTLPPNAQPAASGNVPTS